MTNAIASSAASLSCINSFISLCVAPFSACFKGGVWDLTVSVLDNCLSIYVAFLFPQMQ